MNLTLISHALCPYVQRAAIALAPIGDLFGALPKVAAWHAALGRRARTAPG
jgi:hypothetical protein